MTIKVHSMSDILKNSILTRIELYDKDNGIRVGALVISKNKTLEKVNELLDLALAQDIKTIYVVNANSEIKEFLKDNDLFSYIYANDYDHMLDLIFPNS